MKVLELTASPSGKYDIEYEVTLARVWVDESRQVHVEAAAPEYEAFVTEAQRRIDARLANPNTPIMCLTSGSRQKKDGSWIYGTKVHPSRPGDEDFLETLGQDTTIWEAGDEQDIAGYEVWIGGSKVIEE